MFKKITDYPLMLTPKDIQEILGTSRKSTYDILSQIEYKMKKGEQVPFVIKRIGKLIKIPRDQFWDWFENTEEVDLVECL